MSPESYFERVHWKLPPPRKSKRGEGSNDNYHEVKIYLRLMNEGILMFVCGHITRFNQQANRVRTLIPIHQTSSLRPIKGLLALEPVGWIQTIIYHHILSFSYRYKPRRGGGVIGLNKENIYSFKTALMMFKKNV